MLWNELLLTILTNPEFKLLVQKFHNKRYNQLVQFLLDSMKDSLELEYQMCCEGNHYDGLDLHSLKTDGLICIHNGELN